MWMVFALIDVGFVAMNVTDGVGDVVDSLMCTPFLMWVCRCCCECCC